MNPLLIAAAVGGGLYILSRGGSLSGTPTGPPQPGQPGFVTLGGAPAGDDWNPSPGVASKTVSIAGTGVGTLAGIGAGTAQGILGGGSLAATTTLGAALPFIGIGIAVTGIILGYIAKHHQEALKNEGKVLNSALPRALNAMVLVAQAALRGEITNTTQANALLNQIVKDYYGEVKPIVRGSWPYKGDDLSLDYQKVWIQRVQSPSPDAHAPDPCNAACMIGHFFAERNAKVVLETVRAIFNGQHGEMVLPEVPRHATQAGFPEIRMVY